MKKLILAAALFCFGSNMMAQSEGKTCQDWAKQFEQECVQLKAEVAKLAVDLAGQHLAADKFLFL